MPLWNHYKCSDNKWLALALIQSGRYWHDFCDVVGIGHFENDPKFEKERKREENSQELISILDKIFITRPRKDWLRRFREKGDFVVAPVNTLEDLITDSQMLENNYILKHEHPDLGLIKMVGFPVRMNKTPVSPTGSAPHIGEHTDEVLSEIAGYTEKEIEDLREMEII
jgi:crotonobetainyl-CoA:carnitine CoA-transferase CaiB-like acyl-CoA transferase